MARLYGRQPEQMRDLTLGELNAMLADFERVQREGDDGIG